MIRSLSEFVLQPLRDCELEHQESCRTQFDRETFAILLSAPLAVTLREYLTLDRDLFLWLSWIMPEAVGVDLLEWSGARENREIARLIGWTLTQSISFILLPLIVIWTVAGRPLREYGVKLSGAAAGWWVYAGMFLIMLGPILFLSRNPSFQHTYPFYELLPEERLWPRFFVWEALYAIQFVAIEFFFRGYLLHGTKRRLGPYCILVMTIPYCMIHFGKPLPETMGSIGAGLILGLMSLKTRSIWLGAALHIAVAWTMDAAAIATRP